MNERANALGFMKLEPGKIFKKIVVVGSKDNVGKSSIVKEITGNDRLIGEAECLVYSNEVETESNVTVSSKIFVIQDMKKFDELKPIYCHKTDVFVLIFDTGSPNTLAALAKCLTEIKKSRSEHKCDLVIIGNNKSQMRVVQNTGGQRFADLIEGTYMEINLENRDTLLPLSRIIYSPK